MDDDSKPTKVQPLILNTDEQRSRWVSAEKRRAANMNLAKELKESA
jgi:hypothetical protein